jgi:peptide-methionine (S)-S-oxide reductase
MSSTEIATLGGGCFWCVEAVFREVVGVQQVVSGYSGGHVANPTYEQVCGKKTGHAEVVQVHFDPSVIVYREILEIFFGTHDPTTPNQQGNDIGPQYRSVIFTHDDAQEKVARSLIEELERDDVFDAPIVTEVVPLGDFYPAEEYHQQYFARNPAQPYCAAVISPKVSKFRKRFANRLRSASV